jgi:hypothetical protein
VASSAVPASATHPTFSAQTYPENRRVVVLILAALAPAAPVGAKFIQPAFSLQP